VEVSIFGLLNPVSPLGLLETVGRPVPGILGFNDIKLTIETQGHDRVSGVRASSVHDDLVETVKTHDGNIVARLDQRRIDVHLLYSTGFHGVLDGISKEFDVSFLHVLRDMGS